jgi:hypothetical protein
VFESGSSFWIAIQFLDRDPVFGSRSNSRSQFSDRDRKLQKVGCPFWFTCDSQ